MQTSEICKLQWTAKDLSVLQWNSYVCTYVDEISVPVCMEIRTWLTRRRSTGYLVCNGIRHFGVSLEKGTMWAAVVWSLLLGMQGDRCFSEQSSEIPPAHLHTLPTTRFVDRAATGPGSHGQSWPVKAVLPPP